MDEIHMDKTEELTHPSDDPYIRGLLAPGGELEWLWDATITLTIDGRVLFVDSDRGGRFSRRTLLIDPEDTGALFAVMFCPWASVGPQLEATRFGSPRSMSWMIRSPTRISCSAGRGARRRRTIRARHS